MMNALGWVFVRSSRDAYRDGAEDLVEVDEIVEAADGRLFAELRRFLSSFQPSDLAWSFIEGMNHATGILHLSSSRNRRGSEPTILNVLRWIGDHGPSSHGLVHLHDDEDPRSEEFRESYRVWRLLHGNVEELEDLLLSPTLRQAETLQGDWG